MTNWQVVTTIVFVSGFVFNNLITGKALLKLLKLKDNLSLSFVTGLMITLCMAELVSLPFLISQGEFFPLFILFWICYSLIFLSSCYYLFWKKRDFSIFKVDYEALANPYFIITVLLTIIMTIVPTFFMKFDGDDAFYVAISSSVLKTGRIFANNPSIGLDIYPFPAHYQFTAYEVLLTVVVELLNFEPAVVFHTLVPLIIIPTYMVATFALGLAFYERKDSFSYAAIFTLIIGLMTLFSRYSGFLPSIFVLTRPWMGKSVLVSVCFPTFLCYFLYMAREQRNKKNYTHIISHNSGYFLLITISMIAGVCSSAVGIYLTPVYYFLLFLSLLLLPAKEYSFQAKVNLTLKAFLSVIPTICIMIGFYLFIRQSNQLAQIIEFDVDRNWYEDASLMLNGNLGIIALYFLSLGYFLFYGNTENRVIFIIEPILLLLTFLNPLFHSFVGRYLISLPVYWRLFWLIPTFWTIASFLTETYVQIRQSRFRWLFLVPLIIICNFNNFALNSSTFSGPDNAAKLPDYVSSAVTTILENTNTDDPNELYLLALPKYNIYIRQHTGEIALVMPRVNYVQEGFELLDKSDQFYRLHDLFVFDTDKIITGYTKKFNLDDLEYLDISLIIAPEERPELTGDYDSVELKDGDILYIRKDISKVGSTGPSTTQSETTPTQ